MKVQHHAIMQSAEKRRRIMLCTESCQPRKYPASGHEWVKQGVSVGLGDDTDVWRTLDCA